MALSHSFCMEPDKYLPVKQADTVGNEFQKLNEGVEFTHRPLPSPAWQSIEQKDMYLKEILTSLTPKAAAPADKTETNSKPASSQPIDRPESKSE